MQDLGAKKGQLFCFNTETYKHFAFLLWIKNLYFTGFLTIFITIRKFTECPFPAFNKVRKILYFQGFSYLLIFLGAKKGQLL